MKNILLTVIAIVLIGALGFGVFAYFDTRDSVKNLQGSSNNKTEQQSQKHEKQTTEQKGTESNSDTPSMDEVMAMVDEGKDVNGIVDELGNTWSMNPGKAVTYTNPRGESFTAGITQPDGLDGTDFDPSYDEGEEPEGMFAEEPDQEVIDELQSEIDNAGLQTEMEAKQKELDDYINSFK